MFKRSVWYRVFSKTSHKNNKDSIWWNKVNDTDIYLVNFRIKSSLQYNIAGNTVAALVTTKKKTQTDLSESQRRNGPLYVKVMLHNGKQRMGHISETVKAPEQKGRVYFPIQPPDEIEYSRWKPARNGV